MQHSPLFPINSKCPQIPRTSRLLVQHTSDWPSPAEVRGATGSRTTVTEFVLLGLSDACELQMLIFLGLLLTCLLTLLGNLFVVLTLMDRHLHTPMYYFLRNFAILEIWFTLVIFPKMLSNILTRYRTIFLAGCFLQFFLYFFLGTTEFYQLAVMSFDRYVAICKPLRYVTIMSKRVCVQLVLCSWMTGFLIIIVPSFIIFQQPFCGPNIINHFFCDNFPLLELICADTSLIELLGFILANFSLLGTLSVKATCYGHILHTILQNPSAKERQKAFSTCFSHITVVSPFYGSCIFMYVQSGKGGQGKDRNNVVALLNTMVTPMFNPFIYILRNKQVKQVFREQMNKLFLQRCTGPERRGGSYLLA
ncbi:LOW QUALITY PROTEIN: olfactory receptor 49 [Orcinus orca]|uniref:LOW QUALITY PROTEIN: olfactory receptor 49 n=1 Tax=Orcinus orca TaxID=9733 RepID=UPI00062BB59E|nr:LOW QUALITY PROTEIN: olfactory receptor 49 [Orcinus orca]